MSSERTRSQLPDSELCRNFLLFGSRFGFDRLGPDSDLKHCPAASSESNMTKSNQRNNPRIQSSSRSTDVNADQELILDVNNIQGRQLRSVLAVNIKYVRTVTQLKKAITTRHGLSVQELLYRGVCLGDDRQLAHLLPSMMKIGNSPRFSVRTRLCTSPRPGDVSLFVKSLQGESFQVHLPSQSTIADLKNAIRHSEGYSSEQDFQLLTCGGKRLSAENLSLASCKVVSGSLVHVVGRLLGGDKACLPTQNFVDMENANSLRTLNFEDPVPASPGKPAKPWHKAFHGLSVSGMCRNVECAAYHCGVWCEKGFTVFNISDSAECPSCRKNVTPTSCCFWGCEWMFEGRKTGKFSVDVMSKWNVTTQKQFQWFDDYGGQNTADWSTLIITTKRLVSSEPESAKPILYNCVLCFGPTGVSIPRTGGTSGASCTHAVHPKCVRGFVQAGYSNCPKCRLPLDMVKLE